MSRHDTPPTIASRSFIGCSRKTNGEFAGQRPRLSLYPEYHAGIGLDYYAQFSSPIRRYADLVLQRQLIAALARPDHSAYSQEELLAVLAGAENAEAEGRELERRAKRYWILRYLERHATDAELSAIVTREGASAELADYGVRGTLHGASLQPLGSQIVVQIGRVDPLRGWLTMDYVRPGVGSYRRGPLNIRAANPPAKPPNCQLCRKVILIETPAVD